MTKRKPPIAAARRRPPPSTPDSSESPARERRELPTDEALALFFRRAPREADRLVVTAHSHKGQHIVQDVSTSDVAEGATRFANAVVELTKRWAIAEGHETRFLATWCAGARVLGSYQWACGDGRPPLDGSALSQVVQSQSHAEVMHRLYADNFERLSESWQREDAKKGKRIDALEKELDGLRERLRRTDDLDATLATQQVEADLEQRARTQAILEERVLPILEGIAVRALSQQLNGSVPPTAATEQKQHEPTTEQ